MNTLNFWLDLRQTFFDGRPNKLEKANEKFSGRQGKKSYAKATETLNAKKRKPHNPACPPETTGSALLISIISKAL